MKEIQVPSPQQAQLLLLQVHYKKPKTWQFYKVNIFIYVNQ